MVIELFSCSNCLFYCACMMIMTLIARSGVTWKCHIQRQKVNNSPKISRQRLAVIMVPPLIHVSFQLVQSCFHLYTSTHPSIHSQQSTLPPPVCDYWDHRLTSHAPISIKSAMNFLPKQILLKCTVNTMVMVGMWGEKP